MFSGDTPCLLAGQVALECPAPPTSVSALVVWRRQRHGCSYLAGSALHGFFLDSAADFSKMAAY